jgi:hypothetical protein
MSTHPPADAPSPDVETVLAEHRKPGEFLTVFGEAWVMCSCGTRIDLPVRDDKVSNDDAATLFEAHLAAALRGAGLPVWGLPSCVHCGDPLVWHPGNGGQWLGAVPPRDWARCNGIPEGQQHEAPLAARGAGLPEPSGIVVALVRLSRAVIDVHAQVVMDTPEERDLHDRAVATFRARLDQLTDWQEATP